MRARRRRSLVLLIVLVVAGSAGVVVGLPWWRYYRTHVDTDDAYVHADVALITPRIAGTVIDLPVQENWQVQRGALLARLDPQDAQIALTRAEAALAEARLNVEEGRAHVRAAESAVILAEAELELATRDDARIEALAKNRITSTDDLDRARTTLRVAQARLTTARQEAERARAALGIALDAPASDSPMVQQAQAARDMAALQRTYTELRAPIDGIVATRTVQLGQHVDPGQPLMRVVPLSGAYIEANFKETQLTDVRIGQPVSIVADIYPHFEYHGVVDGLAPGTGAAFALLPPENATGNWIKVVQRVPVKIHLTPPPPPDHPLRVGLSVVATIDVSQTGGRSLIPLSQSAARGVPSIGAGGARHE